MKCGLRRRNRPSFVSYEAVGPLSPFTENVIGPGLDAWLIKATNGMAIKNRLFVIEIKEMKFV
jgi:hypothetical protein